MEISWQMVYRVKNEVTTFVRLLNLHNRLRTGTKVRSIFGIIVVQAVK